MRKYVLALVAVSALGLCAKFAPAADEKKSSDSDKKWTGVLIDQMCGKKQMSKDDPEKAAAEHPKSCAIKDSCAKSGFALIVKKKMYKLDDDSAKKAKDFLENHDTTHVTIEGEKDKEDVLKIDKIEAASPEK